MTAALLAAVVFPALWTAHHVGDHWLQTHRQALTKGGDGWSARLACARHVASLTATKVIVLVVWAGLLGLPIATWWTVLALGIDAASHYWADRRSTLRALADKLSRLIPGRDQFIRLGDPQTAPCGTGAYAMDQSWHHLWLLITTAVIAAGGAT